MIKFIILFFLFTVNLQSDKGDIVVRQTVDSKDYLFNKKSYCRDRISNENLSWYEDFNEETLSRKTWKYSPNYHLTAANRSKDSF